MKRINFLKYQQESEGSTPAISRTTTTKPLDYVGELRVTRFKLSRGTLPIGFIEPSKRGFTEDEVHTVDTGKIPTDIEIFVYCHRDVTDQTQAPHNGEAYVIRGNAITGFYKQIKNSAEHVVHIGLEDDVLFAVYSTVTIAGQCKWERRADMKYYLVNEKIPFYSWSDFHSKVGFTNKIIATRTEVEPTTRIYDLRLLEESDGKPSFSMRLNFLNLVTTTVTTCNPVFAFNSTARKFFGLDVGNMPSTRFFFPSISTAYPTGSWFGHAVDETWIGYVPQMKYDWNAQMKLMLQSPGTSFGNQIFNMDCIYRPIVQTLPSDYFPLSQLLITVDELNFAGEKICVDTPNIQGVIDPSSLTILKTFYIGLSDSFLVSTSDFIYINDNMNNEPVIVDSPRLNSLTIRIWLMTNDGKLTPLMMNPGTSFSIQFSLA